VAGSDGVNGVKGKVIKLLFCLSKGGGFGKTYMQVKAGTSV